MTLNVSCPNCGKRFERIKRSLIGKKAKCKCGQIIRLGEKPKPKPKSKPKPARPSAAVAEDDLMSVDLLGDELLGDQLLGGELDDVVVLIPETNRNSKLPESKPSDLTPTNLKSKLPPAKQPSVRRRPEAPNSKPVPASREKPRENPRDRKRSVPVAVPEVSVAAVEKKRRKKKRRNDEPVFAETYSDLDSILDGAGDAAPIVARAETADPDGNGQSAGLASRAVGVSITKEESQVGASTLGLIAAIVSSTLAFWFGVVCFVSRFSVVDQPLIRGFTSTLHSIYGCSFGDYEINSGLQTIVLGLGWAFWCAALVLMVFGAIQFLNAIYKMVIGEHFFSWCDGLTGAFAVVALFLVVGLLFTQTSVHRGQQKFYDDYERPVVAEGGHLETVDALRAELTVEQNAARNWLIFGAVVPLSVFGFSMVRLFTKD